MYLALDMKSVADACSAVGLDRVGSDWEGVKYHVKAFKKKKLDEALKQPGGRHRTLLKQEYDGASDSDSDAECAAAVISTNVWEKPATIKATRKKVKCYEKGQRLKRTRAENRQEEASAKRRKKKRSAMKIGNDALSLLKAAGRDGWRAQLGTMKVAYLDGLAVRLAVDGKFEGKKDVKQALLEPAVAEWWAEQPVTREARQNNG